jgi:hypothetical protein
MRRALQLPDPSQTGREPDRSGVAHVGDCCGFACERSSVDLQKNVPAGIGEHIFADNRLATPARG